MSSSPSSSQWEPPSPEELQAQLPQYEIISILGRGGMGAVYRARQINLDRDVAIKVLPETFTKGDDELNFVARFEREARSMAKLDHPAILSVHDFGETTDGQLYIVMEFIDGMDIHQYLQSHGGKLPQDQALTIVAHVLDALEYAHSHGIVHRDIKPANILLNREGRVKIADFGLAKKFGEGADPSVFMLTMSNVAVGTPDYLAPEALDSGQTPDHRADLYAVGVMLYQMLTGKVPRGRYQTPSEIDAEIDPRLDDIVGRAMESDPDHRYSSAPEMRADMDCIFSQPIVRVEAGAASEFVAAAVPVTTSIRGEKKASTGLVYGGVGLAAAVVIGLIVMVTRSEKDSSEPSLPAVSAERAAPQEKSSFTPKTKVVPPKSSPGPAPLASKETPFVNSLGMKFVPVPGTEVLFCIHETRYRDYEEYAKKAKETVDGTWKPQTNDGFEIARDGEDHPVTRVNWDDAQKFCAWLSEKEGKTYRLPTDREWSLAVGIGRGEDWKEDTTPETVFKPQDLFPWGDNWPPPERAGNYSDASRQAKAPRADAKYVDGGYDDGCPTTAPVMSFGANIHGLFDLGGNVWEWCDNWYSNERNNRVLRGGSWDNLERGSLLSSYRYRLTPETRYQYYGFRVVLETKVPTSSDITPPPTAPAAQTKPGTADPALARATKDAPFENSLKMKFVPVPGTDVLFCIHETRFRDYEEYAKKHSDINGQWKMQTHDGFELKDDPEDHPVVYVSWEDAQAFCVWLSEKEDKRYRLPTDREWSLAVGIGDQEKWEADTTPENVFKDLTTFPWGKEWPPPPGSGNYSDASRQAKAPRADVGVLEGGYDDGFPTTAPVMRFPPNGAGLFDLEGNVREWVSDWHSAEKNVRVMRGGAWDSSGRGSQVSSYRYRNSPDNRYYNNGFRIVLDPSPTGR